MKNNFKKFKKVPLIFSITLLVVSCVAFIFLYKKIRDNNKMSEQIETEWQMETIKKEELKSLDFLLKVVEKERVLIDTHFIQSSDVVPFLDMIEKLAPQVDAKAEVTLVDVSPEGTSLVVGMKASGTFASLYKFLTLLENSPYQLEFTTMDLRKITDGVGSDNKTLAPEWSVVFKMKLLSFIK